MRKRVLEESSVRVPRAWRTANSSHSARAYPAEYLPKMINVLEADPDVGMVCGNRFNGRFHLGPMHDMLCVGNRLLAFTTTP